MIVFPYGPISSAEISSVMKKMKFGLSAANAAGKQNKSSMSKILGFMALADAYVLISENMSCLPAKRLEDKMHHNPNRSCEADDRDQPVPCPC